MKNGVTKQIKSKRKERISRRKNTISSKRREEILSFAGAWKDLSDEVMDELTIHLQRRRKASDRRKL
ncbi:MAG TPA: hypothetical protein VE978_01935 [Chitinophagales bacterium]|nr:hypothetical protein [Chitinophagales bacterium]